MNEESLINIRKLKPFTRFIYTIGELPTSYLMSMTYEEQLIWLCNYLEKTVIPAINNNGQAVEELQNLYVELKSYVDNYFDNLDVQEEINNKLDDMAESGELADIINQEIFSDLNDEITALDNKTGELSNLETTNKTNLVSAINEVNDKAVALSTDIEPFYCILRASSSGWSLIQDSDHAPLNVQSVMIDSVNTSRLKLTHNITGASKIYSFSICPDETFSRYGIRAGASVGINESYIEIYQTITANGCFRYQNGAFALQSTNSHLVQSYDYDTTKHCLHVVFNGNLRCGNPKYWHAEYNFAPNQASQFTTTLKTLWLDYNELEVYAYDSSNNLLTDPTYLDRVNVQYVIDEQISPSKLVDYPIDGSNFWICGYVKKSV